MLAGSARIMWCERVIRSCPATPATDWGGRILDWVDVQWNGCGRVLKKQTRGGQPVRVLLPSLRYRPRSA
jgi:hypothetical protein